MVSSLSIETSVSFCLTLTDDGRLDAINDMPLDASILCWVTERCNDGEKDVTSSACRKSRMMDGR